LAGCGGAGEIQRQVKTEVFRLPIYVSVVKYQKEGKTEYLIVASAKRSKDAVAEYKVRWQVETMFGCLKSRGFNFGGNASDDAGENSEIDDVCSDWDCVSNADGRFKSKFCGRVQMKLKKNKRYAKSLFRIGWMPYKMRCSIGIKQRKRNNYSDLLNYCRVLRN
jgi:hypothetical protein